LGEHVLDICRTDSVLNLAVLGNIFRMFTRIFEPNRIYQSLCLACEPFCAPPVVLCIGSDRVTGDCFGPLTGEYLVRRHNTRCFVYGNLSRPVTALNLAETVRFLKLRHPKNPVLAVDSALGEADDVGSFRVFSGSLAPGAAAGKNLPAVGDVSLTATVAPRAEKDLFGARLGLIVPLAESAADGIARFLSRYRRAHFPFHASIIAP
jgi:putative sporulation protein YyaC